MNLEAAAIYASQHATRVSRESRDHGPRHWRDVARIALSIAWPECNLNLLFLFAAIHDSQRLHEYDDPDHGRRAARLARHMRSLDVIHFSDAEARTLYYMLTRHDEGLTDARPTVGTSWDADRLTLKRVGITPEVRYLSVKDVRDNLTYWTDAVAWSVMHGPDFSWADIAAMYEHEREKVNANAA